MARTDGRGVVRCGAVRQGRRGEDGADEVWRGKGETRPGTAGEAGEAGLGGARTGLDWRDRAKHGRCGRARRGQARIDEAWQARDGWVRLSGAR